MTSSRSGGRRFLAPCGRWRLKCATYSSRTARRRRDLAISIRSVTSPRTARSASWGLPDVKADVHEPVAPWSERRPSHASQLKRAVSGMGH